MNAPAFGLARQLDPENPWPGLAAFEEEAQDYFHGREGEAEELVRRVIDAQVIVLFGKSGLGKTSLLKAGLFPRLRAKHFLPVYVRLDFGPSAPQFVDQLRDAFFATLAAQDVDFPPLADGESLWAYLHRADLEMWSAQNFLITPLLVIDQFEEVFTLGERVCESVQRFEHDLGDLAENRIPAALAARLEADADAAEKLDLRTMRYKLLLSLREDFLPELEGWRRGLPSLGRVRVRLLPMRPDQALAAVSRSAPQLMDEHIARRIVAFVTAAQASAGAPPAAGSAAGEDGETPAGEVEPALLSLFCRGLNERRKRVGKSKFDDELLDGVRQSIISDYYVSCVEDLPESASRFIENELITAKGFRNSYAKEDAVPSVLTEEQLAGLINRRLLRLQERYGAVCIELTHDLLTGAVREHRERRKAADAARAEREREETERREIEERARAEREQFEVQAQQEREAKKRYATFAAIAGALAFVALAASIWAFRAEGEAREQMRVSVAARMASQGRLLASPSVPVAGHVGPLLSVSAHRLKETPETKRELYDALVRLGPLLGFIPIDGEVFAVAFNPDGRRIASGSADGKLRFLDAHSRSQAGETLTASGGPFYALAYSPDGRLLVSGHRDGSVAFWDGEQRRQFDDVPRKHQGIVRAVAFTPDGKSIVSGGDDGSLILWDAATRTPRNARTVCDGSDNAMTSSPEGRALAPVTPPRVHAAGAPKKCDGAIYALVVTADGKTLVSGGNDGRLILWDAATLRQLGEVRAHNGSVDALAASFAGKPFGLTTIASGGPDGEIRLWDVATLEPLGEPLKRHTDRIRALAFSSDGATMVSAGHDQMLVVWQAKPREQTDESQEGLSDWPYSVEPRGEPLAGHKNWVYSVDVSADGKMIVSAGEDGTVMLWDSSRSTPGAEPLEGQNNWSRAVAFSQESTQIVSGTTVGTLIVWDAKARKRVIQTRESVGEPIEGHRGSVLAVGFGAAGRTIASGDAEGTLIFWDATTLEPLGKPIQAHSGPILALAFSPDHSKLVSAGANGTLVLWDVSRRLAQEELREGRGGRIFAVTFSPDGKTIASGKEDGSVVLWDIAARQPRGDPIRVETDKSAIYSVAFSPDSKTVVLGSRASTLSFCDVSTRRIESHPSGHRKPVLAVAYSPDGKELISASEDGTLIRWDAGKRTPLGERLRGHQKSVHALAFSPDGKMIVSAGEDEILVWDMDPESWARRLCAKLPYNLSKDEWKTHVGTTFEYMPACPDLSVPPTPGVTHMESRADAGEL